MSRQQIRTHRDLIVWQKSMAAAMEVFQRTKTFPPGEQFNLTSQILRSSRSVPANIAEAWRKRRYAASFVSKLNDAEAESAETQTHLEIARRCKYLTEAQASRREQQYEEIISMLATMSNHPEKWCLK